MLLAKFVERLRGNSFLRATAVLAGGTAFAQAITVAVLPVVTRLYEPSDFQVLAVYAAIVQLISAVAGLRLENAVPLPEDEDDSLALVVAALASGAAVALLAALAILVAPGLVARILGGALTPRLLWLIPVGIFASSSFLTLQSWVVRDKSFGLVARTKVAQSAASVGTQVGLGVWHHGPLGLVLGQLLQNGLGSFSLARHLIARRATAWRSFSVQRLLANLSRYRNFPKYDVLGTLAQAAGLQIPLIYIASLPIGPEVGFLSLGIRVMQVPISMISAAVAQVFLVSAAEAWRDGSLATLTLRTLRGLVQAAAGPMVAIAIVAPPGFELVFGPNWGRAGALLAWLTPVFVVHMLSGAVSTVLYVTGRQNVVLALNLGGFALRMATVFGLSRLAIHVVAEGYAISGLVVYAVYLSTSLRAAGVPLLDALREVARAWRALLLWMVLAIAGRLLLAWVRA